MSKFVEFTDAEHDVWPLYIRADRIEGVWVNDDGITSISTFGCGEYDYTIKEDISTAIEMIEEALEKND